MIEFVLKVQKTQSWDKDLNFNSIKATVLSNGKYYYLKCCFDDEENIKDQKELVNFIRKWKHKWPKREC